MKQIHWLHKDSFPTFKIFTMHKTYNLSWSNANDNFTHHYIVLVFFALICKKQNFDLKVKITKLSFLISKAEKRKNYMCIHLLFYSLIRKNCKIKPLMSTIQNSKLRLVTYIINDPGTEFYIMREISDFYFTQLADIII